MSAPSNPPNLNPAMASGLLQPAYSPKAAALTAEKASGTEMAAFRIPLPLKAMVTKMVNDPRLGFNGTLSHFYLEAVGAYLFALRPRMRGDVDFERWATAIERLDRGLELEVPLEEFRRRLDRAEKNAENAVKSKALAYGLTLLRECVRFVLSQDEPLQTALARELRQSKPMQKLKHALLDDDEYGKTDEIDRLQRFMGGDA